MDINLNESTAETRPQVSDGFSTLSNSQVGPGYDESKVPEVEMTEVSQEQQNGELTLSRDSNFANASRVHFQCNILILCSFWPLIDAN